MIEWGILGLVVWIIVAIWRARVASRKGYSFLLWFISCVFFSRITLFIVSFGLKDKNETAQDRKDDAAVDKELEKEERASKK